MEDNSAHTLAFLEERSSARLPSQPLSNLGLPGFCALVPQGGHWVSCFIESHGARLTASGGFLFSGPIRITEQPDEMLANAYHAAFGVAAPAEIASVELWYVPGEGLGTLLKIVETIGFPCLDLEASISRDAFIHSFNGILERVFSESKIRLTSLSTFAFAAQFSDETPRNVVKKYVSEALELSSRYFPVQLGIKAWERSNVKSRTLAFGPL